MHKSLLSRFLFCGHPPGIAICEMPKLVLTPARTRLRFSVPEELYPQHVQFPDCGIITAAPPMAWRTWNQRNGVSRATGSKKAPEVSASSGKETQVSCFIAQAKPSPGVFSVLFFLALIICCAECIAIWTATTSIAGQACSAQEVESHLHRRGNQAVAGHSHLRAPVATLPWEVHGSADRVRQGGVEEDSRQHRTHVAPCFRGLREDRGSESPQGCRQGEYFPSPDEAAHRVSSARQVWDTADEVSQT